MSDAFEYNLRGHSRKSVRQNIASEYQILPSSRSRTIVPFAHRYHERICSNV